MMSENAVNKQSGIFISAKFVSSLLAVLTILAILYGGVSKVNSVDFRVGALETGHLAEQAAKVELSKDMKELRNEVINLTIALNKIEFQLDSLQKNNKTVIGSLK